MEEEKMWAGRRWVGRVGRFLLLVGVLGVLVGVVFGMAWAARPQRTEIAPYLCMEPPEEIRNSLCGTNWVRVAWVMKDSGCPQYDGECWTTWAREDAYGWYQCPSARKRFDWGEGGGNRYRPYTFRDPCVCCRGRTALRLLFTTLPAGHIVNPSFPARFPARLRAALSLPFDPPAGAC